MFMHNYSSISLSFTTECPGGSLSMYIISLDANMLSRAGVVFPQQNGVMVFGYVLVTVSTCNSAGNKANQYTTGCQ